MSIVANRYKGVRGSLVTSTELAKLTREHNNSNVLCLGAGVVDENLAIDIIKSWLTTPYSNEPRHQKRVDKLDL